MASILSLSKSECLTQPIQMQFSENQKIFSQIFAVLPNLSKIWNTLTEKMSLSGDFFVIL